MVHEFVKGFWRRRRAKNAYSAKKTGTSAANHIRGRCLRLEALELRRLLAVDPVINEFMADNATGLKDYYRESSDWIEIRNPDAAAADLSGWHLTDDPDNLEKWTFPAGASLAAGGYLLVFASNRDAVAPNGELHTNFKLDPDGECLALVKPDGTTVVSAYAPKYPEQYADVSYGLTASMNAADWRYFVAATPRSANGSGTSDLGPIITDVSTPVTQPGNNDPIVVTARMHPGGAAIDGPPTLVYRVMYSASQAVIMYDDGPLGGHGDATADDGLWTGTIPAGASSPGQMVRWYVTARDVQDRWGRWPLLVPQVGNDAGPEYVGTVIAKPSVTSTMPIFEWFTQDPSAADSDAGTRASVFYLGEFYDNVFVRLRGGYSTTGNKFEFNSGYDFKFASDQPRVKEFDLNQRGEMDDSYIRPVIAFETYRDAGTPACISFPMRVQRNGAFQSVALFVEQVDNHFMERNGLYEDGALYKLTNDRPQMNNAFDFEKKNRDQETSRSDLQTFLDGLHLTGAARTRFLFDNVNLPVMIDYMVANTLVNDNDDAMKNFFLYRDTNDGASARYDHANAKGTNEWTMLPWDKDLTFGMSYYFSPYSIDKLRTHPFFGDSEHPKSDSSSAWNWMIDALLDTPQIKQMYLRRLRTVMDELLQPLGTPYSRRYYEQRLDELYAELTGDTQAFSSGSLATPFNELKTRYLDQRRVHLYMDHSVDTTYSDYAGIPAQQKGSPQVHFGGYQVCPASGNQDQEYLQLVNPNSFAVDISGWTVRGGVNYTFAKGVVIPAGGTLYVSPNVYAFRNRPGRSSTAIEFVQGNYEGHLSKQGETIVLLDGSSNEIATLTTPSQPSDAQQYLRVSEVMYHPQDPAAGSPYQTNDFEFIELKNVGTAAIDLNGVKFDEGVSFTFAGSNVTSLAGGEHVLVVANIAAFQSRYGHALDGIIAGQFAASPGHTVPSRLDNGGAHVHIADAQGETVAAFDYSDGWYTQSDGQGNSLVIRDPASELSLWETRDGWSASREVNGSPGADETPQYAADTIVINEVMSHSDQPVGDWVELWNMTGADIDIGGWYLSDDSADLTKFEIPLGTVIGANGYVVFNQRDDFGNAANPKAFFLGEMGDAVYLTSAVGGVLSGYQASEKFGAADREMTFGRYIKSTGGKDFVATSAPSPGAANPAALVGPVVISEIMYHPATGRDEYVELKNLTGSEVKLYDLAHPENRWKLAEGIDYSFPANAAVPANGYALVVKTSPAYFRKKYSIPATVPIYGPYDNSLNNDNDTVELKKPGEPQADGDVPYYRVDQISYDEDAPWPLAADDQGASLSRVADAGYGNDAANWQAGRGTPGKANIAFDATLPTVPAKVTTQIISSSQTKVTWTAASDPESGIAYYYVYVNGNCMAATTGTSFTDSWVSSGQSRTYQVMAVNGDNLVSQLPSFALTTPLPSRVTAGQSVAIQWAAGNVAADAAVSFCYDPDNTVNGNETWIRVDLRPVSNGKGSYDWNTTGVKTGKYYVGGYLWSGGKPYFSYLSQPIIVQQDATGPTISGVMIIEAKGPRDGNLTTSESILMTWSAVDPDGVTGATLQVDGKNVTSVYGPYPTASGADFSATLGTLSAGIHSYAIVATDKTSNKTAPAYTGTFTVVGPPPPAISGVVVAEAAAPKNGTFESNEKLRITWAATSGNGIASQSVTVDGKTITAISGPFSSLYYSCTIGVWAAGSHAYTIKSTDTKGASSTSSGTFTVVNPPPPTISGVVVAEAAAPKNGTFESNEKLKITWAATSGSGIASQSVTVDGKSITAISGPFSGLYYSCTIGIWAAGSHAYTIKSTDTKGVSSTATGTFTVVNPPPPTIASVVVAEAGTLKNGILEANERLRITWAASSASGIASQSLMVDGKSVTPISGPFSSLYYSCTIGIWAAGSHAYTIKSTDAKGASASMSGTFTVAAALTLAAPAAATGPADAIGDAQLGPIVTEAISRWETRLGRRIEPELARLKIKIADLPGKTLGETLGSTIWIDRNAAGYGWFVDPTPRDDAEFAALTGSRSLAGRTGTSAATRVDLLTTVMHEMGHVLGYSDTPSDRLMNGLLAVGVRRSAADEVFATLDI
jgi:hypothetical protein